MSDACCGGDEPGSGPDNPGPGGDGAHAPVALWEVAEIRVAVGAGVLLAAGLIIGWAGGPHMIALVMQVAALLFAGSTFVPATLRRLARGKIGVGTLMTIAAVGAVLLGEVGEAAMLAFLFAISEGLEEYAVARTRRGLRALLSLVPDAATVLRGGRERSVPAAELAPGDAMIVKPGERVATDGMVRSGRTTLDTSKIGTFDVSWKARSEPGGGTTTPEELIAAAHASCYSMALSAQLADNGTPSTSVDTRAEVTFDPTAPAITGIALTVTAVVPGISAEDFARIAEATKGGCPVSAALASVPITLDASLA